MERLVPGSILKAFGGILLALGIVGVVGGLGVAGFGWYDESQNREHGGPLEAGYDPERGEFGQLLMLYGAVGAGVGAVLLVAGIVLLAVGSGRATRALVDAARSAPEGAAAGGAGVVARRPLRRWAGIATAVLLLVLVSLVGAVGLGALRDVERGGDRGPAPPPFAVSREGIVSTGVTVAGNSRLAGDGSPPEPFEVPAGTGRLEVQVTWTPGASCCQRLQVYLDRRDGSGWTTVDDHSGPPGFSYNVTLAALGEHRFRVFPAEDGVSHGQEFRIEVRGWP